MKSNHQVKVGIVVTLGIVTLLSIYWFFDQFRMLSSTYSIYAIFDNAQRLQNGADVRLAGVKIGRVESIVLTDDSKAQVTMLIQLGNKIPQDSAVKVTTGAMIGDPFIEITPGYSRNSMEDGARIASQQPPTFDEMLLDVAVLVKKFQQTADSVNEMLESQNIEKYAQEVIANLNKALQGAANVMASAKGMIDENRSGIKQAMANVESATHSAAQMAARLDEMIEKDAQPSIRALLDQANESAQNLNNAILTADRVLVGFEETPGKVNSLLTKADAAADQATQMLGNLNEASVGIKELATDKEIHANVKKTLSNVAEASEDAKGTLGKLNTVLTRRSSRAELDTDVIPEYGTRLFSLWNTDKNELRVDASHTFAFSDRSFYRLGFYDIGANAKISLMRGKVLNKRNAVRYGILASELGVGYDYKLGGVRLLTAEISDPNHPILDIRGITPLTGNLGLYLGGTDLLHSDNRAFIFGIRAQQ